MLPGPGGVGLTPLPIAVNRSNARVSRVLQSLEARQTDVEVASQDDASTPRKASSGSGEPSLIDVESASQTDVEAASQSDVEVPSHTSSIDPFEDREAALPATERIMAQRWQCDLCFEQHDYHDTPWRLNDDCCDHTLCCRCVRGSVQWGGRCPYDNTPIPPIVTCGVMGTDEYVYHEKQAEARRCGGIMCTVAGCPGVAPGYDGETRRAVECQRCGTQHCGRRVCGAPWTRGHRCWDVVEAERRNSEQDIQIQWRHSGRESLYLATKQLLNRGPRFRPCPMCGVMVEHVGGCNMIYHEPCRTRWCFACRRIGTCNDFECRAPGSGPSTPRSPRMALTLDGTQGKRKALSYLPSLLLAIVVMIILLFTAWSRFQAGGIRADFLNMPAGSVPIGVGTAKAIPPGNMCDKGSCTSTLPASREARMSTAEQDVNAVKASEQPLVQLNVTSSLHDDPTALSQSIEDLQDSVSLALNSTNRSEPTSKRDEAPLAVEQVLEGPEEALESPIIPADELDSILESQRVPQLVAQTEHSQEDASENALDSSDVKESSQHVEAE